jgi:aquaglyceroporin related protein
MLGVYVSGKSGSHLNPAVTMANCIFRKFPWRKLPGYLVSQVLGAMLASAVVYGNYKSAISQFEGGPDIRTVPGFSNHSTAGIFCTYPAGDFMTRTGMFFSEFIASSILMFCIYALNDDGNMGMGKYSPIGLFFLIFGIGACFGESILQSPMPANVADESCRLGDGIRHESCPRFWTSLDELHARLRP